MLRGRVDMQPTGPDSVQARRGVEMKQYLEMLEGEREQMTGAQVLDAVVDLVMECLPLVPPGDADRSILESLVGAGRCRRLLAARSLRVLP